MQKKTEQIFLNSLINKEEEINTINSILEFVKLRNNEIKVEIKKTTLNKCDNWYLAENGVLRNKQGTFFSILGIKQFQDNEIIEQPIIIQDEIGFLGIIVKEFNNNLYFLMQTKIEPGNINKIQLSPTIQATRSNFTRRHGGKEPKYLNYFINANKHEIIVDQVQSEQASRFLKKRNRNVIIKVEEDIEVLDSFLWISLYQLKQLLKVDNLVNMDTRTVLSCIPLHNIKEETLESFSFENKSLYNSFFGELDKDEVHRIYNKLNDFKMFNTSTTKLVPLTELTEWEINDLEFVSKEPYPFKVIFADIEIEGREVTKWSQPLLEANGVALFGLMTSVINDKVKILVKFKPEIGSFDVVELGPTIQMEVFGETENSDIEKLFNSHLNNKQGIKYDVILSEEGGRFYHEQNRNVIIEIDAAKIPILPNNYMWIDIKTLLHLIQSNNVVNIQLRNLISLMEVY